MCVLLILFFCYCWFTFESVFVSEVQEGRVGIPLTGLTPKHVCQSEARFWIYNAIWCGLFVFKDFRWEVVVRFVDIGGIHHHCFKLLFINI